VLSNPEISIDYKLTYRDFVAGQRLGVRQGVFTLIISFLTRYVATTVAVIISIFMIIFVFKGQSSIAIGVLPVVIPLWLIPISVWLTWRYGFRRFKNGESNEPQMSFQADRSSFVRHIKGMGELTWLWSATLGVYKNSRVVLVMARRGSFIIIPRRAISDAEISLLEDMWQQGRLAA